MKTLLPFVWIRVYSWLTRITRGSGMTFRTCAGRFPKAYSALYGMDDTGIMWSALAERSDVGALAAGKSLATRAKAVSRCACHRKHNSPRTRRKLSSIPRTTQYGFRFVSTA